MAWTAPATWTTSEVVTAAKMNTHIRDNLLAVDDHETWVAWVPALTASGTSPTLGAGSTADGWYIRTGNIVHATFRIIFGTSGTAAGSGTYRISVPVNVANSYASAPLGSGWIYDSSGYDRYLISWTRGGSGAILNGYYDQQTAGTTEAGLLTQAVPFAWGASDELHGTLIYQAG